MFGPFSTSKDLAPHFHEVGYTDAKEKNKIKDEFCGEQKYVYHELGEKNPTSSDSPEKANFFAKTEEKQVFFAPDVSEPLNRQSENKKKNTIFTTYTLCKIKQY